LRGTTLVAPYQSRANCLPFPEEGQELMGVKPELVMHGGNCNADGNPSSWIAAQGIHGSGTYIGWDFGTSFSAPLVSDQAAQLFGHYENPPVNLVKALLCHFTLICITPQNGIGSQYLVGGACQFGGLRVFSSNGILYSL
jgi:subtilase family protein